MSDQTTLDHKIEEVSRRLTSHLRQQAFLEAKVANSNDDDTRRDVWDTNLLILARNIESCTQTLEELSSLRDGVKVDSTKTPDAAESITESRLKQVNSTLDKCMENLTILVEEHRGMDRDDDPVRFDLMYGQIVSLREESEYLKKRKEDLEGIISFNKSEIVSNELADNPNEVRLGMLRTAKQQLIVAREEFYKHIDQVNHQIEKIENAERELTEPPSAKVIDISTRSEVDQSMSRHPAGSKQRPRG